MVYVFKGVNVCVYVGEGLRRSFAMPDPFVLTNKICLNQLYRLDNTTYNQDIARSWSLFYHSWSDIDFAVIRISNLRNGHEVQKYKAFCYFNSAQAFKHLQQVIAI